MEVANALLPYVAPYCRALGLLSLLPFGESFGGAATRLILAAGLCAPFPQDAALQGLAWGGAERFALEFLLGAVLAVPLALVVEGALAFGELVDTVRGQTIAAIFDPLHGQVSTLGALNRYGAWAIMVGSGALCQMLGAYRVSLALIPSDLVNIETLGPLLEVVGQAAGLTLMNVLTAVTPLAMLGVVVECGLGWIERMIPHFQFSQERFLLKCGLLFFLAESSLSGGSLAVLLQPIDLGDFLSTLASAASGGRPKGASLHGG